MHHQKNLFRVFFAGLAVASYFFMAGTAMAAEAGSAQNKVTTLLDLLVAGGWTMILQALLSVAALASILYHFRTVKLDELVPQDFCENLFSLLEKKEYEKAASVSKQQKNIISAIALGVLTRVSKGKLTHAQIESLVQTEGKVHTEKLWQNLTYLGDIAVVAPLVGLLGTVLGMINAFHYFKAGSIHPAVLTQGLAKAMINTVFGLIIAVICLVFYSYFRGKVSAVTTKAETAASQMVQILS